MSHVRLVAGRASPGSPLATLDMRHATLRLDGLRRSLGGLALPLILALGLARWAGAADYATRGSGDWNLKATWGGSGPPSSGDRGVVRHGTWGEAVLATTNLGPAGRYATITVAASGLVAAKAAASPAGTIIANPVTFDGGKLGSGGWEAGGGEWTGPITITAKGLIAAPGRQGSPKLSGKVSGPGGITLTTPDVVGSGGLTLNNAANDFAGNVIVTQGTLTLACDHALPAGKAVNVYRDGKIAVSVSQTYASEPPPIVNLYGGSLVMGADGYPNVTNALAFNVSASGGTFNSGGPSWVNGRRVTGPIAIAAGGTLNIGESRGGGWSLDGPISGAGGLRFYVFDAYGNFGSSEITGTNNTYSGGTLVATFGSAATHTVVARHEGSLGRGPVIVETNAVLALDKTVSADWMLTNTLAGEGTFKVEDGTGSNRLTAAGPVSPGTNAGRASVLTINGQFAFRRNGGNGTGGTPAPSARNPDEPVAAGVSPAGLAGQNANGRPATLAIDVTGVGTSAVVVCGQLKVSHGDAVLAASLTNAVLALNVVPGEALLTGRTVTVLNAPGADFSGYRFAAVTGAGPAARVIYDRDAVAVTWPAGRLSILNTGCSDVRVTSARVYGALVDTGGFPTEVRCYWGTTDMGEGAWANTNYLGTQGVGTVTARLTGLSEGMKYFYRFQASNARGAMWAEGARSFTTPIVTPLAKAAAYAEAEAVAAVRRRLDAVTGGQAPTLETVAAVAAFFRDLRLHEEGADALRTLARFCTNDTLVAARREEGRALIRGGLIGEGLAVFESIAALPEDVRNEVAYAKSIAKREETIIVQESVALRETLDACSRQPSPGVPAVNLLKRQGDQIVVREDGSGVDAGDFVRRGASKWPGAGFRDALEQEAEKARAALPEGDVRKFAEYWRLYAGTRAAAAAAETLADRLIVSGRPALASACYGALRRVAKSPELAAKEAYALSLPPAAGPLADLPAVLSAEERNGSVKVGDKTVTVEQFIGGLQGKPPETPAPFPGGTGLSSAWKAPVLPSEELLVNASSWYAARESFMRPVCLPEALGRAVFVNTGLSLRRYDAESGSNVWTAAFPPAVVDDLDRDGNPMGTPKLPLPVFRVAVNDGVAVGRQAQAVTSARLLLGCGLTAVDAMSGAVLWRSRDIPELSEIHIASDPCVTRGVVCVLIRGSAGGSTAIRALAIDLRRGSVLWNRLLVMGADVRGADGGYGVYYGFELPRALATPQGICFATHMGKLFMLDALTGAFVWMRSYTRSADGLVPQGAMNPLVSADGAVIAAPYDSDRIFALDAATGDRLWEAPASLDPFLAGVWNGRLVTFGRGLRLRDAKTGATVAAVPLDAKLTLPAGIVNGDRLWVSGTEGACLVDLTTLPSVAAGVPPADLPGHNENLNFYAGNRFLPADGLAVACAPNLISALRPGGARSVPVVAFASTIRARKAPVGLPRRDVREPTGDVSARFLWDVGIPGNVSLPDDDRGLALVHGLFDARLIDTDGFGETYWEYRSTNIIRRAVWSDEVVVLATDNEMLGLDLAAGTQRWRLPARKDAPGILTTRGDLLVPGVTNETEVLCVNPRDGGVRWRCAMPSNRVVRAVLEVGGRLYLDLRFPGVPDSGWFVWELGADGKLGREVSANAECWKNKTWLWDVGQDRVYTANDGGVYRCWDPAMKTMLWKEPYTLTGSWVTGKRAIEPTPDGRPWWFVSGYQGKNAVLDPLTGDVLYRGGGAPWNSAILEFGWDGVHSLSRVNPARGKPAQKAWTTKLGEWYLSLTATERGAAIWVAAWSRPPGNGVEEAPAWLLKLDPATGALHRSLLLPPMAPAVRKVEWKYANSRLFLASQQRLLNVAVMPVAGASDWYAERRQAALRIGDPGERARALRGVNLSEQLHRAAETRWVASAGPLVLEQLWQWVPASDDAGPRTKDWAGPGDLSARFTAAMTASSTLRLVVEVRDDTWVPMDGEKGDAILIGTQVALGLDRQYRPVIEPATPENLKLLGGAGVSHAGSDVLRYTIELPWEWRNAGACNASNTQFNLSFAIRDDDGQGVKGALEWARCLPGAPLRFER